MKYLHPHLKHQELLDKGKKSCAMHMNKCFMPAKRGLANNNNITDNHHSH